MERDDVDYRIEIENLDGWTLHRAMEKMNVEQIDAGRYLASDIHMFLVNPDNRDILFGHIHDVLETARPLLFKKPEPKEEPEDSKDEPIQGSLFSDEELDELIKKERDSEL